MLEYPSGHLGLVPRTTTLTTQQLRYPDDISIYIPIASPLGGVSIVPAVAVVGGGRGGGVRVGVEPVAARPRPRRGGRRRVRRVVPPVPPCSRPRGSGPSAWIGRGEGGGRVIKTVCTRHPTLAVRLIPSRSAVRHHSPFGFVNNVGKPAAPRRQTLTHGRGVPPGPWPGVTPSSPLARPGVGVSHRLRRITCWEQKESPPLPISVGGGPN